MLLVGCGAVAACAPHRAPVVAARPEPPAVAASSSVMLPELVAAVSDSAADEAALDALKELTFKSLSKGGERVRGVVAVPNPSYVEAAAGELTSVMTSRGGAASLKPSYDIDVESFADHDRVQYYVNYYLGPSRDRFTIWLGRLERYEGMIRSRFRAGGVPEDLVYLGLIESGYSNTAVSQASAVGMWQFIRGTARLYGLTVDDWVDERRDPFRATDAAARYLSDLNATFGSWYLAAAAYNGGEGRVSRGLRRLRYDTDSLSDAAFFDLSDSRYLRRETRDYVPKLIAAAIIAKDPASFGFDSVPVLEPLTFDEITVPDQTGLDVLAGLADTTTRAMIELNPQYIRGVTPPKREAIVRVPRGRGPLAAERYAELPVKERVNFLEHTIRAGETLGEIGRRFRVSVSLLRAANNNVDPRRLRIGQRLVIPVSDAARQMAAVGDAPRPHGPTVMRYHVVRAGDTLWKISQHYGVSVGELRRWNGIWGEQVLSVGERVRVSGG